MQIFGLTSFPSPYIPSMALLYLLPAACLFCSHNVIVSTTVYREPMDHRPGAGSKLTMLLPAEGAL